MLVKSENYRNFYFGTGIEHYFVGHFFMMGYEAYMTNPDIGHDIEVTNQSRIKFKNEERKNYSIQIKSSILLSNKTSFWIEKEDFEVLLGNNDNYLICSYYIPRCQVDPYSLVYDRGQLLHIDSCIYVSAMANDYKDYHQFSIDDAEKSFHLLILILSIFG